MLPSSFHRYNMAYSYVQYAGNGSTATFSVPFAYISKSHVEVRVNNVLKTADTDYTWSSASAITFVTAPGTGLTVDIRRQSNHSGRIVDFQDGSTLTQDVLDADSNQNFFMAQEAIDAVDGNIALDTDGVFDADNKRIKNVANPVDAQDVVTKTWAENSMSSQLNQATAQAATATTQAGIATTKAAEAAASASSASSSATTATTKATEASTSATNAASSASAALASKNAAATSETNAAASAAAAASSSSSASSSATSATGSANSAAASATTATTKASDASASATQAANSASGAATSATNAASSASSASASATSAASSASQASTSATNAAASASSALAIYGNTTAMNNAVTSAQNSATSAGTSATNAANSATSASTSASTATTQANTATAKATEAANSASAASSSSSSASSSATNAATSATNAASSATQAAASAASAAAIVTGVASNRPSIRPSLLLDFANTKQLDPRITFSRPTTATYFDSNGVLQTAAAGVPRFDHDPVTGESKGLLIEEQRTNLVTYSDQFDNAVWTKSNASITANAVISPDGSLTADKLLDDNTTSSHHVRTPYTTTNQTLTFSCYLKAAERTKVLVQLSNNATGAAGGLFDLSAGTYGSVSNGGDFTNTSASMSHVGNGWYRCSLTSTKGSVNSSVWPYMILADASGNTSYAGNGTSGIYIWGAQLEAGSFPTSYIPTVASQVTRSADSASMTGSNFSSWYKADEGTLYAEAQSVAVNSMTNGSVDSTFVCINDTTLGNNIAVIRGDGGNALSRFNVITSGSGQANIKQTILAANTFGKIAGCYKANDFAMSFNGASVSTDTLGIIPTVTQMQIGGFTATSGSINGTIKRIAYYPKRLSNTELQGLTS